MILAIILTILTLHGDSSTILWLGVLFELGIELQIISNWLTGNNNE